MPVMKVRDMITWLEKQGWHLARQRGSHRQFKHHTLRGTVTVNGHPSDTMDAWMVSSIERQAEGKGKQT